jgi:hypothetical protein
VDLALGQRRWGAFLPPRLVILKATMGNLPGALLPIPRPFLGKLWKTGTGALSALARFSWPLVHEPGTGCLRAVVDKIASGTAAAEAGSHERYDG